VPSAADIWRSHTRSPSLIGRRQLFELSDDMATPLDVELHSVLRDALLKALAE
jgi:hypothetical protein